MNILLILDSSFDFQNRKSLWCNNGDTVFVFSLISQLPEDNLFFDELRKKSCKIEILPSPELIDLSAELIRKKYISFIANLPGQVDYNCKNLKEIFKLDKHTTLWWFSLISEKNTYKSDSFVRLVQLDAIINTVKQKNAETIIYCSQSEKLKVSLLNYVKRNHILMKVLSRKVSENLLRRLRDLQNLFYLKHICLLFYFAFRSFILAKTITRKLSGFSNRFSFNYNKAIITYYPNIDIDAAKKGVFKNKYYSSLQESLETLGDDIAWIAMNVENNSLTFEQSLKYACHFIERGYRFFFLEEFISFRSRIKALWIIFLSGIRFLSIEKKIKEAHILEGYNFYPIFKDDWFTSFVGAIGYSGILYYFAFKNMLMKIKPVKCLYCCEMHAWEKALICAKENTSSTTTLFAYQHSTIPRMLLNYFNDPAEVDYTGSYAMPRPEKIICNGSVPFNYMRESGWPKEKLYMAEAIRFNHLKEHLNSRWNKSKKIVLVALSISPEESSSILNLAYYSLKDMRDIEVWLKPHPFLNLDKALKLSFIPKHDFPFIIKNGNIDKYLFDARIAIVGESSAAIEALALGCDVITINAPGWVNMSPLKNIKTEIVRTCSTPDELRKLVLDIFKEEYDHQTHLIEARRIINDYFYLNQDSNIPKKFLKLLRS